MIEYNDYYKAQLINKSNIPREDFPAYAAEAERLIMSAVTQMIPDKYSDCVIATACRLCDQIYKDNSVQVPTDDYGAKLKSQSENSDGYSYSFNYADMPTDRQKQAAYYKIIEDGLMYCNGEFSEVFYVGVNKRRCKY